MYDPVLVQPMRAEVTDLGAKELTTPQEVEQELGRPGTTLIFVNSVCGCAAAGARPALRFSLMNGSRPDNLVTVFAGVDVDAVARVRDFFKPYRPSSPQIALLKDGELLRIWQRHDIEGRDPSVLAQNLADAYEKYC